MIKRERYLAKILAVSGLILCVGLSGRSERTRLHENPMAFVLGANLTLLTDLAADEAVDPHNPVHRIAMRLRSRYLSQGIPAPFTDVVTVVEQRRALLKSSVRVTLQKQDGTAGPSWLVGPQRFPLWITTEARNGHITTELSHSRIAETIASGDLPMLESPVHAEISALHTSGNITRAVATKLAKPGYILDVGASAEQVQFALYEGVSEISSAPKYVPGGVSNISDKELGELTLIGSGYSDFTGSPSGRDYNVRKALRDHLNNIIVFPGEEFSFNATLGGPVSERRGWKLAKVISAGDLVMEPGGGICQTSTTLYRGLLQTGVPIGKRKSHSMYVSYYEKGGVGLDATIYYGQQDLTFTNDTTGPILIQAFDEGNEAFVYIYGTPDGRVASMEGPYFSGSAPQEFIDRGRSIKSNEIGWLQRVEYASGIVEMRPILSAYKSLPRSIVYKYTALTAR